MAIDARIPLGVQPLQIQSPMQGAQQALTLRELMAGAAAREAQRDHYRMAQAQAVQQQQAAEAFRAGLAQSGGRMTPGLAVLGLRAGMSPADLQSMAGMQDWGRPKVNQFVETVGPDGRPVKVGVDAYGRPMGEGFAQPVELRDRDLGGEVVPVNPYTGQEAGPRVRKTPEQTELERLMIARGIQPGSPQWNSIIGDYLLKKTTHAPAANTTVYTGTMVPVEGPDGKPAYAMPAKDGTYTIAPGVRPPGTAAAEEKRHSRLSAEVQKADSVLSQVDQALKNTGRWTTGAAGAVLSSYPGSEAYDLRATIDSLKANLSFDQIAEMRANSPTGGALGSVSDNELKLLGAAVANLDANQSHDQVLKGLQQVQKHYRNWRATARESLGLPPDEASGKGDPAPAEGKEPASSGASGGWSIQRVE